MSSDAVLDILTEALKITVLLSAPLLLFGLIVGVIMNIFQAVTQISESTLAIVPKMVAILVALLIFSPWMLDLVTDFTRELYENIPGAIR